MSKIKFYKVGGYVRDKLLGIPSKDVDFAVEAPSFAEMRREIVSRGGEIFLENEKFLTIRAKVPEFGAADYVLCRKDGAYSDNRRPDIVEIGTLLDDLSRRDATVNALAEDEEGNIIDFFDGQRHLAQKLLICVGNPENRIREDALRGLRFLRFSVTKGFTIDKTVKDVLTDYDFIKLLDSISKERIGEELFKMFSFDSLKAIKVLSEYQLILNTVLDYDKFGIWLNPTRKEK
jgi:tRNA nucleotidyltransferase (CCA-adding enzyme)